MSHFKKVILFIKVPLAVQAKEGEAVDIVSLSVWYNFTDMNYLYPLYYHPQ